MNFKQRYLKSTSLQEGRETIGRALVDKMVHSYPYHLLPDDAEIDSHAPLHTYRIDSLSRGRATRM